ncbi:hypothetical protein [Burkholderia pseudomallei]|uniref:hypothetical protein n=1 Tax=Burkholderia pseudomallei TaxID=28450 RepID=UPI000A1A16E4|nr:hypothetical protein [Burkholderia pseudomallei]ARL04374.1 hypothetical protein BOC44_21665 [Burkholderia pseudomallei]
MRELTKANAATLVEWLRVKGPSTLAEIRVGVGLTPREIQNAIGYAIRHGAMEAVKKLGESVDRRVRYKLTGRALPSSDDQLSFEQLLSAWGFPAVPLDLPVIGFRRIELTC